MITAEDTVRSIAADLRAITETPWKSHCDDIYKVAMMGLEAIDAQEERVDDLEEQVDDLEEQLDDLRSSTISDLEEKIEDLESTIEDMQATIDALRGEMTL